MFEEFYNLFNESAPLNIKEQEDKFIVCIRAIGLKKEDIKVEVSNGFLIVSGNRKKNSSEKYLRREFNSDSIYRKIELGESVNLDNGIDVRLSDGILTVELSKGKSKNEVKINFE